MMNQITNFYGDHETLDWVPVQWQNMAFHGYKNAKLLKPRSVIQEV